MIRHCLCLLFLNDALTLWSAYILYFLTWRFHTFINNFSWGSTSSNSSNNFSSVSMIQDLRKTKTKENTSGQAPWATSQMQHVKSHLLIDFIVAVVVQLRIRNGKARLGMVVIPWIHVRLAVVFTPIFHRMFPAYNDSFFTQHPRRRRRRAVQKRSAWVQRFRCRPGQHMNFWWGHGPTTIELKMTVGTSYVAQQASQVTGVHATPRTTKIMPHFSAVWFLAAGRTHVIVKPEQCQ